MPVFAYCHIPHAQVPTPSKLLFEENDINRIFALVYKIKLNMQQSDIFQSFTPWGYATSKSFFCQCKNGKNFYRSKSDDETDEDEDYYSPTSWERHPGESEEDYNDRIEDQEDFMDYYE